jgi:hypothetical protein
MADCHSILRATQFNRAPRKEDINSPKGFGISRGYRQYITGEIQDQQNAEGDKVKG